MTPGQSQKRVVGVWAARRARRVGLEGGEAVAEEVGRRVGHRQVAGDDAVDVADDVGPAGEADRAGTAEAGAGEGVLVAVGRVVGQALAGRPAA